MEIVALRIEEADQILCDKLSPYLSQDRRKKLEKFKFLEDRLRSLFSELLVRTYAIEKWGMANDEIHFNRNMFGKPAISGFPQYQFNISHSGHWVVAVFDNLPVGIDIEEIAQIDLSVSDFCFSQVEKTQLSEQPNESKLSYFFRLWTLKESYIKAVGKGLSTPLQSFSFTINGEQIGFQSMIDNENWCFHRYVLDVGYELSVCGLDSTFPKQIHIKSTNDLVLRFQSLISNV
jgi:4'-phosphopantetheinyl transferase